jgi:hypothetical protein
VQEVSGTGLGICGETDERDFVVIISNCGDSAVAAVRTSHGGDSYRVNQALMMAMASFIRREFPVHDGWGWSSTVIQVGRFAVTASCWRNAKEHEGGCYFSRGA